MTKDFADFLESLNREGVAYVVIRGMAVLAHIPYRTTRDLDILIQGARFARAAFRRTECGRSSPRPPRAASEA